MAPTDYWKRQNGSLKNIGVDGQIDAQITGGEVYLNIPNRSLDVFPARDGSGAIVHMSVPLPNGVSFTGSWVETTHGWKRWMDNGWLYRLLNLQSIKVPQALSAYKPNGAMFVWDKIPISDVVNDGDGYWRPKDLQFDVTNAQLNDFIAAIQPPLTQQQIDEGKTRPAHIVGGIVVGHKDRRDNNGKENYMTGKFLEIPAPLLVAWDEDDQYVGHFFGTYENAGGGRFPKAYHIQNALAALGPAQNISYLSISADLGYTTNGASDTGVRNNLGRGTGNFPGPLNGDVTINSLNFWHGGMTSTLDFGLAMYTGATRPVDLVDSATKNMTQAEFPVGGAPYSIALPTGTGLTLDTGKKYWFVAWASGTSVSTKFDDVGAGNGGRVSYDQTVPGANWSDFPPDPLAAPSTQTDDLLWSFWADYDLAVSTPVTTNAAVTPTSTPKGSTSVDISCDIDTASETITDAEWFFGADPGEGSGNSFDSLTGTATSKTATADIDPSALDYAVNVISMRGFDAVNGWGDVDTAELNITLAPPTSVVATPADQQITVTWVEGADAGDQDLYWDTESPVDVTSTRIAGVSSGEVVGSLTNGETYFFAVVNNSHLGAPASGFSEEVSAVAGVPVDSSGAAGLNIGIGLGIS